MPVFRVALIVPALTRKGPVIVARDLAEGLVARGISVTVYYLGGPRQLDFPCPTERLSFSKLFNLRYFHVIHSHSLRPDAAAWFLRNVMRMNHAFVSTIHNYVDEDLRLEYGSAISIPFSWIWKRIWRGLDAPIVLTRDAQRYYSQCGLVAEVIYNSRTPAPLGTIVEPDRSLIAGLRRRYRLIVSASAVNRRKALDQVLIALTRLPNHAFMLIGDGPELDTLRSMAARLGVTDRFLALGFRGNVQDYLKVADLYAMTSESEGMPLALLEAAQAGLPIVCSDIPVHRELFDIDEVTFFKLHDADSLVTAINRTDTDSAAIAARATARVQAHYTFDRMIQSYVDCYKNTLRKRQDHEFR